MMRTTILTLVILGCALTAGAEQAGAPAIAAWEAYVRTTEAQLDTTRTGAFDLLTPSMRTALERGEVAIEARDEHAVEVPDGLLHHWRAHVFVPGTSLTDLLAIVRDPAAHVQDDVLEAKLLARNGDTDRVYLKIRRSSLVTVAYNTEHVVRYRTHNAELVTSRSEATKIAEIEGLGTASEREKPAGDDRGFLWRMHAYWRYEAVRGGVLVTLDSLTLSRGVPWAISPIASPIVTRVARESVVRTLRSLRARF
jgi:hypothetical protein